MTDLSAVAMAVGFALALCFAPALLFPGLARGWCARFPRNTVMAWVLTASALAWAAYFLWHASFVADISWAKPATLIGAPIIFLLVVFFLDELLAPRALGGILMLIPRPMLEAAFVSDSHWKLPMTLGAYVFIITGIVLMLSPFRFRKAVQVLLATDARSRLTGAVGVTVGLAMAVLGLTVYR